MMCSYYYELLFTKNRNISKTAHNTSNKLILIFTVLFKSVAKYRVSHKKKHVWCLPLFCDNLCISKQFKNVVIIALKQFALSQNPKILLVKLHRWNTLYTRLISIKNHQYSLIYSPFPSENLNNYKYFNT